MIRAVLFDLDGTLCDCAFVHFQALNSALISKGCDPITWDEHVRVYNGLPTREKLQRLFVADRITWDKVAAITEAKQANTVALMRDTVKFDPQVYCLIAGLVVSGFQWGVVTNAVPTTALLVLTKMHLPPPDCLITNEDATTKPDPAPYLLACRRLEVAPDEALVIEDGRYGIESATAAGCLVMRVSGPMDLTPDNVWKHLEVPC